MRDFTRGSEIRYPWVHVMGVGFMTSLFFHHTTLILIFCVVKVGFEASVFAVLAWTSGFVCNSCISGVTRDTR